MATTPMGGELLHWIEIGRSAPGNEPWTAWIADGASPDSTLYRCLILVAGKALVTVDIHRRGTTQTQRLHAGQCALPQDRRAVPASVTLLLDGADQATCHALSQSASAASRAA